MMFDAFGACNITADKFNLFKMGVRGKECTHGCDLAWTCTCILH